MSLQFIIGSSGAGKSYYAYEEVIRQSREHPDRLYYVIVPEQFTMQTQKTLVEMHPGKGILNIDILSFERLAYRVFEEVGGDNRKLLEDTGKSMVLQKMVQKHQKELPYLGSQMKKPGYLDEVKSLLSEFMQYDIQQQDLEEMLDKAGDKALLHMKLKDVGVLYEAFRDYLEGHYMTSEEVMDVLLKVLPLSEKLRGSVLLLDGFTGFTPIQNKVIRELLAVCSKVSVTVTMDIRENPFAVGKPHQLFFMSRKMIHTLSGLTRDLDDPVMLSHCDNTRFANAPALQFLEKYLFRYKKAVYEEEQEEIQMFSASSPQKEVEEAARRMARLVRTKGYRYGEIAVITGNMEEYKNLAEQVFREAGIPYFLDEKHTVLMNPFVECLRGAIEMAVQGFSYESVFRYLRCGMSGVTREETDKLENYVLALGIRGYSQWSQKWVRIYYGMPPEEIQELNESRARFIEEVKELAEGFQGGRRTVEEYCRTLYEFIVKSEIQKKLKTQELYFKSSGDKAMEKEYGQIYGIIMELLDKMVEILGEETVSRQEFRQLLETGLSEAKVGLIPPSMDQVLVGDMERTRLKDIKALFFLGMNEGNIPKNTESGGILTEIDREFFSDQGMELAPGPKELMNMQRFYLYLNLTKPRELLCLSYSQSNSRGEALSPAYLVNNIKALYPGLTVLRAEEQKEAMDCLEHPGAGLDFFLGEISQAALGKSSPVFQELYTWYLKSPKYSTMVKRLVDAYFCRKPKDVISQSVAKVLYGEISPYSATRLERFSACAFAHFLQYGLKITERAEYEFRAMDLGNVMHQALENFAQEVLKNGHKWSELTDETRDFLIDKCLDEVAADYGNTILKSSERNRYMIERTRRILRRTAWALQQQLKEGEFLPEGFEVVFQGGRIDRVDVLNEEGKVYVKVIDYKTGSTSFDLVSLYHGLQMQLVVYMDGALQVEQKKYPDKEIIPAGIFYYNIKDPMIQEKMHTDIGTVSQKLLNELKMNGLVQADKEMIDKMDRSLMSVPVSYKKDGNFSKTSSVATREQFAVLNQYVKKKIADIREAILEGDAQVSPYELGNRDACTYCPYHPVCGFDKKLPGYEFRRLKNFSDDELWEAMAKEVE
ncbi:MAG: helicase-exonuclease AddAB subunit AddB [Eubacteriales bacterium]|nr:helicase-exonuclease AddAB subunit AddB [Eubacteriales bacterium]